MTTSSSSGPAPAPPRPAPRRRRALLLLLFGGLLVGGLVLWLRQQAQDHLAMTLRDPAAGFGACWDCHGTGQPPRPLPRQPPAPLGLALLPGGDLLVGATGDDSLYRLDPARARIRWRLDVGPRPHGVAVVDGGARALVALRDADALVPVDLAAPRREEPIPVGREPTAVAVAARWGIALVTNSGSDDVSVVDLPTRRERYRLPAGREPYAVAIDPQERLAVVANRLVSPHAPRTPPSSEVTVILLGKRPRVLERRQLPSIHLAESVAITPDGQLALIPAMVTRNLLPTTQTRRGWVAASVLVVLELAERGRIVPILLDGLDDYHADPTAVALEPAGRFAYLASGGRDRVLELDLAKLRRLLEGEAADVLQSLGTRLGPGTLLLARRFPTAANPRGLAVAEGRLYVSERLADGVAVFDLAAGTLQHRFALGLLGGPSLQQQGEQLFYRASAYQGQFSCRTCHPDGHLDGLTYDFEIDGLGENFVDNRSLRGLVGTAPFKWTGLNPTLDVQCGPRFSRILGRSRPFSDAQSAALHVFVNALPTANGRRPPVDTPEVRLGREVFYRTRTRTGELIPVRDRCPSCHPAPTFTSQTRSRVGTGAQSDFTDVFDAPHLLDLRDGLPYLHDGRAGSLMELFVREDPAEHHGRTRDLDRVELNALVEYLRAL